MLNPQKQKTDHLYTTPTTYVITTALCLAHEQIQSTATNQQLLSHVLARFASNVSQHDQTYCKFIAASHLADFLFFPLDAKCSCHIVKV